MGMGLDDFCRLDADEFRSVCESWHAQKDTESREAWYRMRWLATLTLQPYSKRKLKPEQVLKLPWEEPTPDPSLKRREAKPVTKAESLKRFKKLVKRWNG